MLRFVNFVLPQLETYRLMSGAPGGRLRQFSLRIAGIFVTAGLLFACGASHQDSPSTGYASGIIGGSDVPLTHPLVRSVVGIYLAGGTEELSWCTGVLLPKNIVLTAAHCVTDLSKMVVFFGTKASPQSPRMRVDAAKVSPNWNGAPHVDGHNEGDIALLHIAGQAPAGAVPLPILPPEKQSLFPAGTQLVMAGYGINDALRNTGSGVLRMATARLQNPLVSPMEIMIDQTAGKGACHGDSGGPALVIVGNQPYVWGITNRGVNDSKNACDQLVQSANASRWKLWIEDTSADMVRQANGGRNNPFSKF